MENSTGEHRKRKIKYQPQVPLFIKFHKIDVSNTQYTHQKEDLVQSNKGLRLVEFILMFLRIFESLATILMKLEVKKLHCLDYNQQNSKPE